MTQQAGHSNSRAGASFLLIQRARHGQFFTRRTVRSATETSLFLEGRGEGILVQYLLLRISSELAARMWRYILCFVMLCFDFASVNEMLSLLCDCGCLQEERFDLAVGADGTFSPQLQQALRTPRSDLHAASCSGNNV